MRILQSKKKDGQFVDDLLYCGIEHYVAYEGEMVELWPDPGEGERKSEEDRELSFVNE